MRSVGQDGDAREDQICNECAEETNMIQEDTSFSETGE